jgi:hypothetical protein
MTRDIKTDPRPGDQIILRNRWMRDHDRSGMEVVHVSEVKLRHKHVAVRLWERPYELENAAWEEFVEQTDAVLIAEGIDAGE